MPCEDSGLTVGLKPGLTIALARFFVADKALWEKGDFTRIAATMRASGEALVDRLGIRPGIMVLDLGSAMARQSCPRRNAVSTS